MIRILSVLFVFTYSYALVRYHLGKNIPWYDWLYVLNKSFAWTSFLLIGMSILPASWFEKRNLSRKQAGLFGYAMASIHASLYWFVLPSSFYDFCYTESGVWAMRGICCIATACLAYVLFTIVALFALNWIPSVETAYKKGIKLAKWGFLLLILHPFLMGYYRWFNSSWPFMMPPITLLAIVFGFFFFIYRWKLKR